MYEKIKQYLDGYWGTFPDTTSTMAKDITEIVKAELSDTIYADLMKSEYELQKENADLKSKISKLEKNEEIYHERLKLNRDKIIEVLGKYLGIFVLENIFEKKHGFSRDFIEQIADEIMKGN